MVPEEAHRAHSHALAQDPLIGRTLNGRFHIVECIGVGGMGRVYKAVQEPLDRLVALKVLSPSYAAGKDPDFKRRFSLEASLTSKLRHPNTVTVIDYGQTGDGIYYIAMEYLEGFTLAETIKRHGALAWPRAVDIAQQMCRSLREAHRAGIIHRDLKPANVMLLDQDGDSDLVKVLDFGLVKSFIAEENDADVAVTKAGMFLGSPQYMAPEQARNQVSPRSDVYSLGVVLYHMLAGRPPFVANDSLGMIMQHVNEPPPSFKALRPDLQIPPEVEVVVGTCMQKDPNRRYSSMDEVLRALRRATGQPEPSGIMSAPTSFPPTPSRGLHVVSAPRPRVVLPLRPMEPVSEPGFAIDVSSGPGASLHGHSHSHPHSHGPRLFGAVAQPRQFKVWWALAPLAAVALSFALVALFHDGSSGKGAAAPAKEAAKPAPAASAEASPGPNAVAAAAPAGALSGKAVRFRVQTQPNGAAVWLDGKRLGQTPLAFEMPAGPQGDATAELTFTLDGYHPLLVTAGGYGEVLLSQRLQRRTGKEPNIHAVEPVRQAAHASSSHAAKQAEPPSAPPATLSVPAGPVIALVQPPPPAPQPAPTPAPPPLAAAPAPTTPVAAAVAPPPAPKFNPNEPVPFTDGMTRPQQLSGVPPSYSREAMSAHVQGMVEARCVVTVAGKLDHCRLLKSLPHMDQAVLDSLASRRYKPATYRGSPVAVDYVLDVQVGPPPPFDEDRMSGPTKLTGPDPEYTPEAMDRQVEGTMEVRCVVTATGRAHSCQVLKALPFMSRPVVEALERRTYSPARLNGQPLDVQYIFRINLKLPE